MNKTSFGKTHTGEEVSLYEITNDKGMKVLVTDFGATVVSIFVNDKDGNKRDVVLGYDDVSVYEKETCYFGATVGRYANRISDAKINIDGIEYVLEANDNENNLHSGSHGTSGRVWNVKEYKDNEITFTIEDKDLEQGYPGNAVMNVTYTVTEDNELAISYNAKADKTTTFNMTNHSYFNLNGHKSGKVYSQILQIKASHYTPVKSAKAIPTGEIAPVEGTPFDFRQAKPIGQDIEADDVQLGYGHGYDHNFAIDKTVEGIEKVADVYSPESGICMEVLTDNIGIQLYTANFIGGQVGKDGYEYEDRGAFCLETQFYPNSINEPNFTTPITKAGEEYNSKTVYRFAVR